MTSIFFAIAMLCQLNVQVMIGLEDINVIEFKQLDCQQYYASCLKTINVYSDRSISQCIIDKK